jgi:DNA polymerase-3 subunit gamma/tau
LEYELTESVARDRPLDTDGWARTPHGRRPRAGLRRGQARSPPGAAPAAQTLGGAGDAGVAVRAATGVSRVLGPYRTYRPGRLSDVIGQEHVTVPLARAIDSGRAHHAYLFTGPRGCGKTSTARILARSLNCEEGPTSEPCGVCPAAACAQRPVDDVVEMDAASHRGIDDARATAMYAPAASRYTVYIIDEAHQLTVDAANALLKLIEEPPPHLKFVFATTEPDKILATIRSRTHHYPYRLVTARRLQEHLAWMCEQEGVPAQAEALALVARAGAGSVRDAQCLGQLSPASGLRGSPTTTRPARRHRHRDARPRCRGPRRRRRRRMFSVIDRVVEAGLDHRASATDLLGLRDLVVHEVPTREAGLIDAPDSQVYLMRGQAEKLGLAQLSRAADLVSTGLSELKGATAPRLQLELLCARLLLPAADDSEGGIQARLDRLEPGSPPRRRPGGRRPATHAAHAAVPAAPQARPAARAPVPTKPAVPTACPRPARPPTTTRALCGCG